jgi:hypothetical protein
MTKRTELRIPVYYTTINRRKVIDEDSMREEFEDKLAELLK